LRSLGYRMDRKPKPPEAAAMDAKPAAEVAAPADVESKPVEAAEETVSVPTDSTVESATIETVAESPAIDPVRVTSSRSLLPQTDFFPSAVAPVAPPAPSDAPLQQPVEQPAAVVEAAVAPVASAEVTAPATSTEPEMIEVWRPAGRAERKPHHARRPRPQRHGGQTTQPSEQAAAPADQAAAPAAESSAEQKPVQRQQRRDGAEKHADRQGRHDRQQRQEWQKKRDERNQRDDRPRRRDRGAPVDRAERDQYYAKPGFRTRQNKEADPNSPFAKLAALKQQLEDGAKGRTE
jgi:ATP-dependent RNA helicase SUPV3L1/SUV3